MKPSLLTQLEVYVEQRLPEFHQKRLEKLATLKLKAVLSRKNPYLFRAKAVNTSEMLVRQILDAHLSTLVSSLPWQHGPMSGGALPTKQPSLLLHSTILM